MDNVKAHRGSNPLKFLARPIYGLALRQVLQHAQKHLDAGRLDVKLPGGQQLTADSQQPGPHAKITIRDYHGLWMIMAGGDMGFAEAYMAGHIDVDELKDVLDLASANESWLMGMMDNRGFGGFLASLAHARNDNSKDGSKRNIFAHYDLGNTFYSSWLDQSMTYSSAVFDDINAPQPLYDAQQNKYRRIAEIGNMTPDSHVLEIGCGWGGFAEFAAKNIGCRVTGLTISQAQYNYAAERIQKAGLNEKVDLRIQDYRDVEPQSFDRVASIEMFEAVGEKHWPAFFGQVRNVLKPGGRASMQIITIADTLFDHYRASVDFIQKYIFPGGMLPSEQKLREISAQHGLSLSKDDGFGLDYARTLLAWNQSFQAKWPDLEGGKFDEPFRRMWEYYLKYCAVGFEQGRIDVRQIAWDRET